MVLSTPLAFWAPSDVINTYLDGALQCAVGYDP